MAIPPSPGPPDATVISWKWRSLCCPLAPSPSSSPTSRGARRSGSGTGRRWRRRSSATGAPACCHRAHGGVTLQGRRRAVQAAFPTAPEAVAAALAAQRALVTERGRSWSAAGADGPPYRRRDPPDGDYLAPGLNRLSRLLAAAHGGQMLLSLATQDLARDALPPGAASGTWASTRCGTSTAPSASSNCSIPSCRRLPPDPDAGDAPQQPAPAADAFLGREEQVARLVDLLRLMMCGS